MKVLKRKILLENLIDRSEGINYGIITASTIQFNIFLTHNMDDMGMLSNEEYNNNEIETPLRFLNSQGTYSLNYNNQLIEKLINNFHSDLYNSLKDPILTPTTPYNPSDFYFEGNEITFKSSSRINELKTYNKNSPYILNLVINKDKHIDYKGRIIFGVSTLFKPEDGGYTGYCFDAVFNENWGRPLDSTGWGNYPDYYNYYDAGIKYNDLNETVTDFDDELNINITSKLSNVTYKAQGHNRLNTELKTPYKEEKYMGVVSEPEVQSEVFIDRGNNNILEPHLRLSEIESLEHLTNYMNGSYYKIKKQTL